ncbi:MAG: hypothetical protein HC929_12475 [Leptolyngbyaceae cyanobacterium SM2_5_2]|nr:hypothetical protein [Leptolyngbyaceae cyanobacterium SM2_5_2]
MVLTNERDALLQQQQILVQADGQLRQQYASLPNKQLERDRLAQQVALNQALYDQIQARRIDAEAAEAETVSSLIVAQPPVVNPVEQPATNPALIMALGGLLGAIAAGAVIFLLDMLDGTLRTARDIETLFEEQDVPVLGLIPTLPNAAHQQHPALLLAQSPYLPAYEDLRTKLRRSPALSSEREPKLVLVTSNWAQEGKTTTALNLAIASARAGRRTLIIEADVQQPSQTLWLGLTLPPEATREPRRYYAGHFGDPIQLVPQVEHLYLAPSPGPQLHGAAVLESSEMKQFLIDARARFDLVLLDGPPLSRNTQSLALASQTDGLLLVARPGYAEKAGLETLLEDLLDTEDLVVLGAVVNTADATITTPVERVQAPTSTTSPVVSSPAAPARPVDFF